MTYNERRPRRQAGASSEPLAPARLAPLWVPVATAAAVLALVVAVLAVRRRA